MTKPTALVTGTSGYLGARIADQLEASGAWEVLRSTGRGDLERSLLLARGAPLRLVVHAGFEVDFGPAPAAGAPESANLASMRKIREAVAAAPDCHLIFLSAGAALGVSDGPRARTEDDLGQSDPGFENFIHTRYATEKITAERMLAGLPGPVTVLYPTTVYGPGMHCETLRQLAGLRGPNPVVPHPPGGTSFTDLRDFLEAMRLLVDGRVGGRFVVSGGNLEFRQLFAKAIEFLGVGYRKRLVAIPDGVKDCLDWVPTGVSGRLIKTAVIASSFGYKYYSPSRLTAATGWVPQHRFEDALATLDWNGRADA